MCMHTCTPVLCNESDGIRVVGKNKKLEGPKLKSSAEIGKSQAKLERTERSWKNSSEVGKL